MGFELVFRVNLESLDIARFLGVIQFGPGVAECELRDAVKGNKFKDAVSFGIGHGLVVEGADRAVSGLIDHLNGAGVFFAGMGQG